MHILIVDDDIINRAILTRLLHNLGYQVSAAESGKEALQLLAQISFDLVLMDCQMPDCDGYTTTTMIRSTLGNTLNPDIPVIALTANSTPGTRERCLAAGMDDYLIKPAKPDVLQNVISKYLAK